MDDSPHREHAWWHDYKERGTYLITIVVKDRQHLFGELNNDIHNPYVQFTDLGKAIQRKWLDTIAIQQSKGRAIRSLVSVVMPDHFHGVIFVEQPMDVGLGEIIRCFKLACTQARNRLFPPAQPLSPSSSVSSSQPCMVDLSRSSASVSSSQPCMADLPDKPLSRISHHQRGAYYAQHPDQRPLFDDNFDDSICYSKGQLDNIIRYVKDNPRRAVMRAVYPQLFQRRQHISIGGQDYAAYGNLFLLRRPWKEQVFCHRRMDGERRDYNTPYEATPEFARERELWLRSARLGAVLVTPGISKGEQQLLNDCLDEGLPLIHLQSEPIPSAWNPPIRRHHLCEQGKLLILSPWQLDAVGEFNGVPSDTQYSRFHNLNTLAHQICESDISLSLRK